MPRIASYRCWAFGREELLESVGLLSDSEEVPEFNKVAYEILGNCCYFSGIERGATSTVNAAESVIRAIADQEEISILRFRWFDLQTHRGYPKRRGSYELSELSIGPSADLQSRKGGIEEFRLSDDEVMVVSTVDEEDFTVTDWRPVLECPMEVFQLFREYIGEPRVVLGGVAPGEARKQGLSPTETHDDDLRLITTIAESWSQLHKDFAIAVVDNKGSAEDLARANGARYTMWQKDDTPQ